MKVTESEKSQGLELEIVYTATDYLQNILGITIIGFFMLAPGLGLLYFKVWKWGALATGIGVFFMYFLFFYHGNQNKVFINPTTRTLIHRNETYKITDNNIIEIVRDIEYDYLTNIGDAPRFTSTIYWKVNLLLDDGRRLNIFKSIVKIDEPRRQIIEQFARRIADLLHIQVKEIWITEEVAEERFSMHGILCYEHETLIGHTNWE